MHFGFMNVILLYTMLVVTI